MNSETFANPEILNFYKLLPFNSRSSIQEEIKAVRKRRIDGLYPGLAELLRPDVRVLEVGCGTGWLSNSINFLYHADTIGIDFNPVAIGVAQDVAKALGLTTEFLVKDLFLFEPTSSFDVVISFGVLHHTNNCAFAVRRICEKYVRASGYVMIGLYHQYGRKPFLDHFNKMRKRGATEKEMFDRYKQLQSYMKDETLLLSWFRDQVLNPHETQHTLEEMLPLLEELNMKLISTSINRFEPIGSLNDLVKEEKKYTDIAQERLKNNEYFTGFFTFLAQKNT